MGGSLYKIPIFWPDIVCMVVLSSLKENKTLPMASVAGNRATALTRQSALYHKLIKFLVCF